VTVFAALLRLAASAAMLVHMAAEAPAQTIAPMDDQRFWSVVERSAATANQAQQEAALRRLLAALPVADLVAWQAAYDAKRAAACRWDLWGAAYVIHGGASDDGFDYFRSWLISRGRRVFEAALADPDSLAAAIPVDAGEAAESEGFGHVAMALWAKRTGRDPAVMPRGEAVQPAEPTGTAFSEDPAALAARYPKLWKRFGEAPLE
jgi:hypothetical protein